MFSIVRSIRSRSRFRAFPHGASRPLLPQDHAASEETRTLRFHISKGPADATGRSDWPRSANHYDLLKVVAVLSMILDHVNDYAGIHSPWLLAAGRIAMPLFLFLVGFNRSTRIPWTLGLAFLLVVPLQWELRGTLLPLNILFSIGLCRCFFRVYERFQLEQTPRLEIVVTLAMITAGATSLIWEYGSIGLLWALFGRLTREKHPLRDLIGIVAGLLLILAYWPAFPRWHLLLVFFVIATWCILKTSPLLRPLPVLPGRTLIVFLSRLSLWIYVDHLAILVVLSTWMHWGKG
jgi:hypothetical protein